ncbi:hypothetical protein ElyMa_003173100 [Elysia marginata]|uniref:Uncharacterized protein n=1 Tax=Elysia marginata TaxID=1093978 RepID=A0AAV4IYR8_9GAST|nr:hypothetical protein ElyMa_003173100 [Elysia marginata]
MPRLIGVIERGERATIGMCMMRRVGIVTIDQQGRSTNLQRRESSRSLRRKGLLGR